MRKINLLLLTISLFFMSVTFVKAANTMKYVNVENEKYYFVVDKDKSENINFTYSDGSSISYKEYSVTDFSIPDISETFYGINTIYLEDHYTSINDDTPDKWWGSLYACAWQDNDVTPLLSYAGIKIYTDFSDQMEEDTYNFWEFISGSTAHCHQYVPKDATKDQLIYQCRYYDETMLTINNLLVDYENSKLSTLQSYNEELTKLQSFCSSALSQNSYNDPCVSRCLNELDKDLKGWNSIVSKKTGTRICGFSEKLIQYIANIIRWAKYIIPVIVIVLGIIDFIRATATDKDDEMKKAQGNFVKRLIAAALIFIVPFIIEFVLDIMGFDANGCGIIDL